MMPRCSTCDRSSVECCSTTCLNGHGYKICDSCQRTSQSCPVCASVNRRFLHAYVSTGSGGTPSSSLGSAFDSSTAVAGNPWVFCDVCSKLVPNVRAWSPSIGRHTLSCYHVACEQCRQLTGSCSLCRRMEPTGNGDTYVPMIGSSSSSSSGGGVGRALLSRNSGVGGTMLDRACCHCREACPRSVLSCDYCKAIACSHPCVLAHMEFVHRPLDVARFVVGCNGAGSESSPPSVLGQQSSSSSSSSAASDQQQQRLRGPGLGFSPRISASSAATFGLVQGFSFQDRGPSVGLPQSDLSGRYSVSSSGSDGSSTTVDTVGRSHLQSVDRLTNINNIQDVSMTSGRSTFEPLPQIQSTLMTSSSSKVSNSLREDLERRLRNLGLQIDAIRPTSQQHARPDLTSSIGDVTVATGGGYSSIDFGNLCVPPPLQQQSGMSEHPLMRSSHQQCTSLSSSVTGISPRYPPSVDFITPPMTVNSSPGTTAATAYQLFQQAAAAAATKSMPDNGRPFVDNDVTGHVMHIDVLRDRLNEMVNAFNVERRRASPQHSFYDVVGSDGSERSATCIVRCYTTGVIVQLNNSYGAAVDDDVDLDVVLVVAAGGGTTRLTRLRRPEVGRRLFDFTPTSDGLHFVNATIGGRPIRQSPQRFLVVGKYPLSYSFQPPLTVFADDPDSSMTTSALPSTSDDRLSRFHATWNLQEIRRLSGGSAGLMKPWGVCVDPSGTQLLVADRDAHRIVIFDLATSAVASMFGQHGSNPGQFHRPTHIAFDSAGRVVVTDKDNHRVQVFVDHVTWRLDSIIGGSGHVVGLFRFPWEVAINRRDDVLVSDSKNFRVQLFARRVDARAIGYRVVGVYAFDSQPSTGRNDECKDKDGPRGVAFDPFGFVIVADYDRHRLLVLSHDLRSLVHVIGHVGWSAVGQIDRPRGLAVDPNVGSVYLVVSRGNRRINHVVKMCPKTGRCLTYPLAADMCGICRVPGGRVAVVTLGTGSGGTSGATKNGVVVLQDTSPF